MAVTCSSRISVDVKTILKDIKKIAKGGIKNVCDGIYDIMNAITTS